MNTAAKVFHDTAADMVPGFVVDKDNEKIIELVLQYMCNDPAFEQSGFNLRKGLFLAGPVGTGKTDLMLIMRRCLANNPRGFMYTSIVKLVEMYAKSGYDAFAQFNNKHLFIDELGLRQFEQVNHYGTKTDVAEAMILSRYNQFKAGYLTHFTTNIKPSELEQYYDGRTASRLREMCNFIPMPGTDRRLTAKPRPVAGVKKHEPEPDTLTLQELKEQDPELYSDVTLNFKKMGEMADRLKPKKKALEVKPLTQNSYIDQLKAKLPEATYEELNQLLDEANTSNQFGHPTAPEIVRLIGSELERRLRVRILHRNKKSTKISKAS